MLLWQISPKFQWLNIIRIYFLGTQGQQCIHYTLWSSRPPYASLACKVLPSSGTSVSTSTPMIAAARERRAWGVHISKWIRQLQNSTCPLNHSHLSRTSHMVLPNSWKRGAEGLGNIDFCVYKMGRKPKIMVNIWNIYNMGSVLMAAV